MKRWMVWVALSMTLGGALVGCGGSGNSIGGTIDDAVRSVARTNLSRTLGLGGLNRQMAGILPGAMIGGGGGMNWFGDIRQLGDMFGFSGFSASREVQEESGYLEWMNLWFKSSYDDVTGEYRYELFEDEAMTRSAGFREYKLETPPGTWPQRWVSSYRWQDMDYYAEPIEHEIEVGEDGTVLSKPGAMPPAGERIWREGSSVSTIDDETYSSGSTIGSYSASNGERSEFEYTYTPTTWSGKDVYIDAQGQDYRSESSGSVNGDWTSRWQQPDSRGEIICRPDGSGEGTLWDGQGNLIARTEWTADGVVTIRYADGTVEVIDYRYSEGDAPPKSDDSEGSGGGGFDGPQG